MANHRSGLIDVGGGMRGIYAAGVLDRCLDDGVSFDVAIGISAGSANVASFLADQKGRNFRFYTEYSFRPQYMGPSRFLLKRSFIDLDYVYSTLSNAGGEDPLDYAAFAANPTELLIVGADARTGEPRYFTRDDIAQDRYDILKASSALPVVCHPYKVDGIPYYDGALGAPVPVQKALDMGCDRIVLLLTKPKDKPREPGADDAFARMLALKNPKAAASLRARAERYNEGVALAKELEAKGEALIIAPDDTCGVDTLTKDKDSLYRLYAKGYADGAAVRPFLDEK